MQRRNLACRVLAVVDVGFISATAVTLWVMFNDMGIQVSFIQRSCDSTILDKGGFKYMKISWADDDWLMNVMVMLSSTLGMIVGRWESQS